jgi:hypothetical protein
MPRPNPPHPLPGGGLHSLKAQTLIAVNRGPEATTLEPRLGSAPKTLAGNSESARLLAKTPNQSTLAYGRAERPVSGQPTYERSPYGLSAGQQLGNIPVYRPTSPTAGSHSVASSFAGHASGGSSPSFSASSAGSFHGGAVSAPSAPAAPSGGGAGAAGGHVK